MIFFYIEEKCDRISVGNLLKSIDTWCLGVIYLLIIILKSGYEIFVASSNYR